MKALLALLAAACVAAAPVAADATRTHSSLVLSEQRALALADPAHLKSLVHRASGAQGKSPSYNAEWLASQPKASGDAQWRCLSEALYFEARGESVPGQFAVAEVILNRVRSERFPDSICSVVNQGTGRKYACQFTYTCDGNPETIHEPRAWDRVGKVARTVIDAGAAGLTDGATHYHTTAVRPGWAKVYNRTAAIGVHLFYRHTWQSSSNSY